MSRSPQITGLRPTAKFEKELRHCPADVQQAAKEALERLLQNANSGFLRLHRLHGYPRPALYKIDVMANKSWQISLEIDGTIAVLLRICTHAQMDRSPR